MNIKEFVEELISDVPSTQKKYYYDCLHPSLYQNQFDLVSETARDMIINLIMMLKEILDTKNAIEASNVSRAQFNLGRMFSFIRASIPIYVHNELKGNLSKMLDDPRDEDEDEEDEEDSEY